MTDPDFSVVVHCNAHTHKTRDADVSACFFARSRSLAAGDYEVVTDEELIEGLSFPAYRRVATMILIPAGAAQLFSIEMVNVDPNDLAAAHQRDHTLATATTVSSELSATMDHK